ncbi:hypothetical protein IFM47457_07988 [Aspergillus lentulus]|nr:hypothetical protein IFM47457_07988 [Aspergillus lentulus]
MEGGGDEARGEFHAPCITMQCRSCDGEGIALERCRECVGVGYLRVYCGGCEEGFRRYQYRDQDRGRGQDGVEKKEMDEKRGMDEKQGMGKYDGEDELNEKRG